MTWLGRARSRIGEIASWLLALVFERSWAQRALVHSLSEAARVRLVAETARESSCPADLAREALRCHPRSGGSEIFELALERLESEAETLAYAQRVFGNVHEWLERHAGGAREKRILELGPGHTLAVGALLVASGAKRWVGADRFPIASQDPTLYEKLRDALARDRGLVRAAGYYQERQGALERFDAAVRLEGGRLAFDEARVSWQAPVDAASLPFPDASFEVCLSNAAFEHFSDPERAVRESVRVLVPGGHGIHQIDLRDHRDFARPLDFLRCSDEEWASFFGGVSFVYTNRWRRGDYLSAFARAGALVVSATPDIAAPVPDDVRAALHPRFRDLSGEDLETLSLFLVVRRPG